MDVAVIGPPLETVTVVVATMRSWPDTSMAFFKHKPEDVDRENEKYFELYLAIRRWFVAFRVVEIVHSLWCPFSSRRPTRTHHWQLEFFLCAFGGEVERGQKRTGAVQLVDCV